MRGSKFIRALPEGRTKEQLARRDQMIFDAVRRRDIAPIKWMPVTTTFRNQQGHTYKAKLLVAHDALRVGDGADSVRVSTRHDTAQRIADDLGVVLTTAKIADEIWKQAAVRLPSIQQAHLSWVNDGTMSRTSRMLEQHNLIEKMVGEAQAKMGGKQGLIADVGKDWITTAKLEVPYKRPAHCEAGEVRSANYGWRTDEPWLFRSSTLPGVDIMQPIGLCHTISHTDYSQMVRLVRREVEVCGPGMGAEGCAMLDIDQIATDPALAGLVSHEGVLQGMRHPQIKRTCDPSSRCVKSFVAGMNVRSFCVHKCDKVPPPEEDPTVGMPDERVAAAVSYVPLVLGLAVGVTGALWAVKQPWFPSRT